MKQMTKVLAVFGICVSLMVTNSKVQAAGSGTLIRAEGGSALYFLDFGVKRLVDSMETFRIQGFQGVRDITALDLAYYPEGEIVTSDSTIAFVGEAETAPDIAPFAPSDLHLVDRDGRKLLLFTTEFWNRGRGPLELLATTGKPIGDNVFETAQRLILPDSSVRNKVVGNLFWHEVHKHFHYDNFASYVLELVPTSGQVAGTTTTPDPVNLPSAPHLTPMSSVLGVNTLAPEIVKKSTFCIYETTHIDLPQLRKIPTGNFSRLVG
jgi:hypothetical protein